MENNLVIRIGLNKCATTFLNRVFFANHPEINHLGKPYDLDDPRRIIVESIIERNGHEYDLEKCQRLYDEHVKSQLGDTVTTISDTRIAEAFADHFIEEVPQRIKNVFGECKIMFTIRNQLNLVESYYVQFLETRNLTIDINQWVEENWTQGVSICKLLQYDKLYERYVRVFGKDNVQITLLEDLKEDKQSFLDQISRFLNVSADRGAKLVAEKPMNPRMSEFYASIFKFPFLLKVAATVAKILPEPILNVTKKLIGHNKAYKPKFSPAVRQKISEVATVSNQNLMQKLDLPLGKRGYPL